MDRLEAVPAATPVPGSAALSADAARAIVARVRDGILAVDRDWRCTFVNEAGAALLGTRPEMLMGAATGEALAGADGDPIALAFRAAMADRVAREVSSRVAAFGRWIECRIFPEPDGGLIAFFADVTARREAEDRVGRSERRLNRAQQLARLGSWEYDLAAGLSWGSAQALEIYGLPPEPDTAPWAEMRLLTVEEDRPRVEGVMTAMVMTGAPYDVVYRIRRRSDGALRVVHSLSEVVRDERGVPVRIAGTLQDITEQVEAEADRTRLVRAIEQSADIVMLEGTDRRLTYVNPAFTRVYGYAAEEAVGRIPDFLASGSHPDSFWAERAAVVGADLTWTGTITNRCRDGSLVDVDASISPVRGDDGAIVGYVQVARDVTAQRALEARLTEAQRMEAVGQLAGGIAHDFNNLLTAIRGYAGVVLDGLPEGDLQRRDDLAQIIEGADRAAALTHQLLAYSRRQVLEPVIVDPAEVTAGVLPLLRRLIGEHIELRFRRPPEPLRVLVDPGQLEQVVVNLTVNARDAMSRGGHLSISIGRVDVDASAVAEPGLPACEPGRYVRLTFTDDGVGIDPEARERIFDPFFTTKAPGKGTGMGLATVHGIVTQSGGVVTVESTVGAGTTFHVDFPEVDAPPTPEVERPAVRRQRGTESILLVEDDTSVRGFARRVLEEHGYAVREAGDAQEAMAAAVSMAAAGLPLDLLVSDVLMPGRSGGDLALDLLAGRPDLRVVLASGYPEDLEIRLALPPERSLFLPKPYTGDGLLAAIRRVLGQA